MRYYTNLGLWAIIPPYVPWDFSLIPVVNMFSYKIKPRVNPIIKGVILSALEAFVGEPILAWSQIYNLGHWKYYYSFPILDRSLFDR